MKSIMKRTSTSQPHSDSGENGTYSQMAFFLNEAFYKVLNSLPLYYQAAVENTVQLIGHTMIKKHSLLFDYLLTHNIAASNHDSACIRLTVFTISCDSDRYFVL